MEGLRGLRTGEDEVDVDVEALSAADDDGGGVFPNLKKPNCLALSSPWRQSYTLKSYVQTMGLAS